ncbi:MAG: hypothetical protein Q9217_002349 [Psora testacea]
MDLPGLDFQNRGRLTLIECYDIDDDYQAPNEEKRGLAGSHSLDSNRAFEVVGLVHVYYIPSGAPSLQICTNDQATGLRRSLENLSTAQSIPQSDLTSSGSPFLSPPLYDPIDSSPPPRPDAEDYLAARKRPGRKNKSRATRSRKHYNTREESEEMSSSQSFLNSGPLRGSPQGSYSGLYTSGSKVSDTTNPLNTLSRRLPTNTEHLEFSHVGLKSNNLQTSAVSTALICSTLPNITDSPAVNALRRLSQSGTSKNTSELVLGRKLSETVSAALSGLRPRLIDAKSNRSSHTLMPATITVRKASAAPVSKPTDDVAGEVIQQRNTSPFSLPPLSDIPASQLVAFRSTLLTPADTETPPPDLLEAQHPIIKIYSGSKGKGNQGERKSIVTFEGFVKRPRSTTAGTAMTLADVRVAPGTFYVDAKSRKPSMASRRSSRRLSMVQFRSRSSVHEIIWREDESTSESGSSKIASPQSDHLQSRVASIVEGPQKTPPKRSRPTSLKHNGIPGVDCGSSFGVDENLFRWSWGRSSSPSRGGSESETSPQPVRAERDPVHELGKELLRQMAACKDRQRSVSTRSSVPALPLCDRRPSAEWRQTALLDLYGCIARRQTELQEQATADSASQRADMQAAVMDWAANQRAMKTRGLSSHDYATGRTTHSGKLGSRLGSSSHQRVKVSRLSV